MSRFRATFSHGYRSGERSDEVRECAHPAALSAAHLLETGDDIRTIQELLGHRVVATTIIHTDVLNRGGRVIRGHVDGV